jgi:hypothetical protein
MAQTEPKFKPGDRFFTHYDMKWGTVVKVKETHRGDVHGVTGSKLPDTTWYEGRYDDGSPSLLDDAHGNWDMARMVPPHIAKRYGYGDDPLFKVGTRLSTFPREPGSGTVLETSAELRRSGIVMVKWDGGHEPEAEAITDVYIAVDQHDDEVEQGRRDRRDFYRNRDY